MAARSRREAQSVEGVSEAERRRRAEQLSADGYVPLGGGGDIHKWEIGAEVSGKFCGVRLGSVGKLFDVETQPGTVETWGCSKGLAPVLQDVALGTDVVIVCVGKAPSKRYANERWVFEVYARTAAPA